MLLWIVGNGDIVCVGFYGIVGQCINLGICYMCFNLMIQEVLWVDLFFFIDEFLLEFMDEVSRKQVLVSQYYQLCDFILCFDEGIVFVVEQYFCSNSVVNMQYGVGMNVIFYYNDIMVVNIVLDGIYIWLWCIFKQ